jgi:DNA-binding NarL/FixJ family response regulator
LLEPEIGLEVCYEASDGLEALEYVKKHKPELVVLDLTMPEMNGLDALRKIREVSPDSHVLVLTMHFSEDVAREALRAGADGYVLKSDADADLLSAVRHVQARKPFFTGALAASLVNNYIQELDPGDPTADRPIPGTPLTGREVQVLQMLAGGMSNKEIAPAMGLSIRTVESHRNHIMHKMKFNNFSDLMRFAIRNHLVEP